MPLSAVSRITLHQSGKITIHIKVPDWQEGLPIEISGQVTQENGAVATFYSVQPMPPSGKDGAEIQVSDVTAVPPNHFVEGFDITVVARATEAWITMLRRDSDHLAALQEAYEGSDPLHAAWQKESADWAVAWPGQKQAAWRQPQAAQASSSTTLLRHGTWWDRRKADPLDAVMGGRFTRLFPDLPGARFNEDRLRELAHAIAPEAAEQHEQEAEDDPEENPGIPAAYTYLGQFVDHDLTFDPISHLRETLSPAQLKALVDFRTPRFDLDNLYGRGPDDQPYLYDEDGIYLLPGESMSGEPFDPAAIQLPRGPNGRALIGDPRNDENRIVAQLHAIFLRFHNEVVDRMGGKTNVSFQEARQFVRWHYQWVLVNDFLRTIINEETYNRVFRDSYNFVTAIPRLRANDLELMPVEFSVAAYRFGHSMIRPRYRLNPAIESPIPIFSDHPDDFTADLGGFRSIPPDWAIDWQFFINLGPDAEPQLSYKIDTSLVPPLAHLPPQVARDPSNLAQRNLQRGQIFQLPSGQQVAEALGMPPIANENLMIGKAITDTPPRPLTEVVPDFGSDAPLWVYILSEAQVTSWENAESATNATPIRLGPVGGQLVAEVFASLLRGDPTSYLHAKPAFRPFSVFSRGETFGLAELINVALGHTR